MEILKDYDIYILYHSGKKNVVKDALSQDEVSMGRLSFISTSERLFTWAIEYLAKLMVLHDILDSRSILASVKARSTLFEHIQSHHFEDRDFVSS